MITNLLFIWLCFLKVVGSVAPPHPDFAKEYNAKKRDHHLRRRQMSQNSTGMKLTHLSPEFCHALPNDKCLQWEKQFSHRTRITRNLVESTGSLKVLVLCVRFQDHQSRTLPSRDEIDYFWNAGPGQTDSQLLPTGSVAEYLRHNSYNKFWLEAEIMDWMTTDNTEAYYAAGVSGQGAQLYKAFDPILDYLESAGEDFSIYDNDGDGVLDSVIMVHSGYPAEAGGFDCVGSFYTDRIWSHTVDVYDNDGWVSSDGKYRLGTHTVVSALRPPPEDYSDACDSGLARIGIATHEFLHTFGLPDLYETDPYGQVGYGSGYYDIMSDPHGVDGSQIYPSNLSPWSKMKMGWMNPIEIKNDGEYFITPSALDPKVYMIRNWFREGEYLLIENRQPIGYDSLLWGGGLLIWHIDDNVENNNEAGFPQMSGWPGNGLHYRVAVLGADRKYHLERGINAGNQRDFWVKGQELLPGPLESDAKNFSLYPNSNSYTNGPTGIRITDISPSRHRMSFKVEGLKPLGPPTSRPSPSPTPRPTPTVQFSPYESSVTPSVSSNSVPVSFTELETKTPTASPSIQLATVMPVTEYPTIRPSTFSTTHVPSVITPISPVYLRTRNPSNLPTETQTTLTPSTLPNEESPTMASNESTFKPSSSPIEMIYAPFGTMMPSEILDQSSEQFPSLSTVVSTPTKMLSPIFTFHPAMDITWEPHTKTPEYSLFESPNWSQTLNPGSPSMQGLPSGSSFPSLTPSAEPSYSTSEATPFKNNYLGVPSIEPSGSELPSSMPSFLPSAYI